MNRSTVSHRWQGSQRPILGCAALLAGLMGAHCASTGADPESDPRADGAAPVEDAIAPPPFADAAADGAAVSPIGFERVAAPIEGQYALTSIWGSARDNFWIVGARGLLLHGDGTTIDDATFKALDTGTLETFFAVQGTGADDAWITSSYGLVMHVGNLHEGAPLTRVPMNCCEHGAAYAVRAIGDTLWILVGAANYAGDGVNYLWRGAPTGGEWTPFAMDWSYQLGYFDALAIWVLRPDDIWMTGSEGRMFRWRAPGGMDAGPATWTEVDAQSWKTLRAIWGADETELWAVGDGGRIRRWRADDERQWSVVSSPTEEDLNAIWGSGPRDIWAAGNHGVILHFDGEEWTVATSDLGPDASNTLRGIWGSSADDVWIVGDGVVLHHPPRSPSPGGGR